MYCQMKKKSPSPCLAPPIIVHGSAHAAGNHNQGSVSCLRFLLHLSARLFRSLSQKKCTFFFFFPHKYFSARSMSWITTERDPASARTSARQVLGTHDVGKKKRNTTGIMCYITLPLPLNHLLKPKPHSKKIFWQEIITNTHGYHNVFYHPRERRGNRTQNFLSKQLELYNYS